MANLERDREAVLKALETRNAPQLLLPRQGPWTPPRTPRKGRKEEGKIRYGHYTYYPYVILHYNIVYAKKYSNKVKGRIAEVIMRKHLI